MVVRICDRSQYAFEQRDKVGAATTHAKRPSNALSFDCRITYSLTQWYCPPDVGAMDAISAIDKTTVNVPRHTTSVIQIAPAVPPFAREKTVTTRENSHVSPRTMTAGVEAYESVDSTRCAARSVVCGFVFELTVADDGEELKATLQLRQHKFRMQGLIMLHSPSAPVASRAFAYRACLELDRTSVQMFRIHAGQ